MKHLSRLLPVLLLAACGKHDHTPAPSATLPSVTVKVEAAKWSPHTAVEEVVGTVRSKQRAVVEAKVSGRVLEYTATPGAMVKAGDLLARLDVQEINARLEGIMVKAFDAIWRTAQERRVSIRTAAFIIACERVLAAREQRGLYP